MYCPYCGANNDRGEGNCFVCEKPLPSLNVPVSAKGKQQRVEKRTMSGEPELASVGDRFIALVFDRIVIAAILVAVGGWFGDRLRTYTLPQALWAFAAIGGALFLVTFLYHFLCEAAFLTTPGKAAMGLHIGVEEGHSRIGGVALRNLLRIIDSLGFYLIGFLFATFTLRRQRVGDLIGKTVVLDWPIARGGRAAMMFVIVLIVAASVWVAWMLCPSCMIQARGLRP